MTDLPVWGPAAYKEGIERTDAAKPEPCTDMGNARRFAIDHSEHLRYCHSWGCYLEWDGRRWLRDDAGRAVERAKRTVRRLLTGASEEEDPAECQRRTKWALESQNYRRIQSIHRLGRSEPGIPVGVAALDADPWLLAVANGTLELKTGTLRPSRPADLITRLAPVAYDAHAECPKWLAFLYQVLGDDRGLVGFLQRAIGYTLTGLTIEQVFLFLFGTGANGKSVLLRVLAALFGDYAQTADFSTFLVRRSEGPRNDLARLDGARLVIANETGNGSRFDEGALKLLTGGDRISARFLHAEHFEYTPAFTLWIAANHRPVIQGTDNAIWRRVRQVPFSRTIPEADRDPHLGDRLLAELPGILTWAVKGCLAWERDGLGAPPAVIEATADYRRSSDILAGFLSDRCLQSANGRVGSTKLYKAYRAWAQDAGEQPASLRTLTAELRERGLHQIKSGGCMYWLGIALKAAGEDATEDREGEMGDLGVLHPVREPGEITRNEVSSLPAFPEVALGPPAGGSPGRMPA